MIVLAIENVQTTDVVTGEAVVPVMRLDPGVEPFVIDNLALDRRTAELLRRCAKDAIEGAAKTGR